MGQVLSLHAASVYMSTLQRVAKIGREMGEKNASFLRKQWIGHYRAKAERATKGVTFW